MFKLSSTTAPQPDTPRIYRLRTNDDVYKILFECECLSWDENMTVFEGQTKTSMDDMESGLSDGSLVWTVEWIEK